MSQKKKKTVAEQIREVWKKHLHPKAVWGKFKTAPPRVRMRMACFAVLGAMALQTAIYNFGGVNRAGYASPQETLSYRVQNNDFPEMNTADYVRVRGNTSLCHSHFPVGAPQVSPSAYLSDDELALQAKKRQGQQQQKQNTAFLLCHNNFAAHYDIRTKTPLWVSHVLRRKDWKDVKQAAKRSNKFNDDPYFNKKNKALAKYAPTSADYARTGFHQGHLAPAGDFAYDQSAMDESFFMTNIAPQAPKHNTGIWRHLESDVRKLLGRGQVCQAVDAKSFAKLKPQERCRGTAHEPFRQKVDFEELYVTTGTAYIRNSAPKQRFGFADGSLGTFRSGQKVPNYFYKVILEPRTGMAAAYLIPNTDAVGHLDYHRFRVPLTQLEKSAGVTFFPDLDKKAAGKVKRNMVDKNGAYTGGWDGLLDGMLF